MEELAAELAAELAHHLPPFCFAYISSLHLGCHSNQQHGHTDKREFLIEDNSQLGKSDSDGIYLKMGFGQLGHREVLLTRSAGNTGCFHYYADDTQPYPSGELGLQTFHNDIKAWMAANVLALNLQS